MLCRESVTVTLIVMILIPSLLILLLPLSPFWMDLLKVLLSTRLLLLRSAIPVVKSLVKSCTLTLSVALTHWLRSLPSQ